VATLPIFPLGAVLFPNMPLRLRVFEERYLVMLSDMLRSERGEFGVVLIERGHEVGGGEHRFEIGTTAEITELGAQEGIVGLQAQGHRRFRVIEWLDDAPHPMAVVTELAAASEFVESTWPPDVVLADEPVARLWQLAGIAPIGPMDQLALLGAESVYELVERLIELTGEAAATYGAPWPA
jgi:uncharacterized protein